MFESREQDMNSIEVSKEQSELLEWIQELRVPAIAAPMFLVSGPDLMVSCCRSGIVGSMPAPNARTVEQLDDWLVASKTEMAKLEESGHKIAPWMLNMIVHKSYDRFDAEVDLLKKYQPPLVSTALGSPKRVIDDVHSYGGKVVADVITPAMARKAADAGVDAIILVCNGAGGHTGMYNPFAFVAEVRKFWKGPLGLAGAISSGRDIHAAQILGCDFGVIGTRFIAAHESLVRDEYRDMLVSCGMEDLVASKAVSGVLANWMKPSLAKAGMDLSQETASEIDFSGNIASANKAWKHVWSAGHGVGQIEKKYSVSELLDDLDESYKASTKGGVHGN